MMDLFFDDSSDSLTYLSDLTLWYEWHAGQGSLPDKWQDYSLPQIAHDLGLPAWTSAPPWRLETPGLKVVAEETAKEQTVRSETPAGRLVARWTLGPDGDWWQTEYPVKTADDLPAALELAQAHTYVLDPAGLERQKAALTEGDILAIELPRCPYSQLLHDFLGWSQGLLLLREPEVEKIIQALEITYQSLVAQIARLPGQIVLAPDNLDGQFISPQAFDRYLTPSYRQVTETLHQAGKRLVVHVGGPIKRLLAPLAQAGVDALEGIAGPPQSDAPLSQARQAVGPELVLWGGIPQDFLLETRTQAEFGIAVRQAVREAQGDGRVILGVADRVPVEAELERLEAIPTLIERAWR